MGFQKTLLEGAHLPEAIDEEHGWNGAQTFGTTTTEKAVCTTLYYGAIPLIFSEAADVGTLSINGTLYLLGTA